MKKKKLLVTGTNIQIVKDYILHSQLYFKSMSTTCCWADLEAHFECYEPDGYLLFPDSSDDDMISQINKLKSDPCYNKCPIFICAAIDVCGVIQRENPQLVDLLLKRPVSADNLSLRIQKHFDELEKERIREEAKEAKKAAEEAVANDADAGTGVTRKKHILIVDDDRTILKMLKAALEGSYEVTTMVNGVLVQKFLASREVDLILLDYEMPIKTGAEVMRDIKADEKYAEIPICFLTGVTEREKVLEILKLRPNAYMEKPINMEQLIATVSNLID
jgi:response regulator RpfG family c-di-GMP phosphodiesterase